MYKRFRMIDKIIIIIVALIVIVPIIINQINLSKTKKIKNMVKDVIEIVKEDIKDIKMDQIIEYVIDNNISKEAKIISSDVFGKGTVFVDVDKSITVVLEYKDKCAVKYSFSNDVFVEEKKCDNFKLIKGAKMQIVNSGDGLYKTMNNTYIYKGLDPNNYLQYYNKLYRIMEINNKIKMISEEALDTRYKYYDLAYGPPSIYEVVSTTLNGCKMGEYINCEKTYLSSSSTWLKDVNGDGWYLYTDGNIYPDDINGDHNIRPVMYLSSDIKIIGGNGTLDSPYIVNETILEE